MHWLLRACNDGLSMSYFQGTSCRPCGWTTFSWWRNGASPASVPSCSPSWSGQLPCSSTAHPRSGCFALRNRCVGCAMHMLLSRDAQLLYILASLSDQVFLGVRCYIVYRMHRPHVAFPTHHCRCERSLRTSAARSWHALHGR